MNRASFLAILAFAAITSGVPAAPPVKGHLVIAGGGLGPMEKSPVHARIKALLGPTAKMGVVPTASGEDQAYFDETVRDFQGFVGGAAGRVSLVPLTTSTAARAFEPAVADGIRACGSLYFVGGDQSRILQTFRPKDKGFDSPAYKAAMDVLGAGGTIAGSSAGAAMMSDPMLTGGASATALRVGAYDRYIADDGEAERRGVGIGRGMGFFPFGLTDQHFLKRGRLGRLVAALEATTTTMGFGVDERRGIDVDLATGKVDTLGTAALLLVNRTDATRSADGLTRKGIRVSLLGGGDTCDARTGAATPASGAVMAPAPKPSRMASVLPGDGPFAANQVIEAVRFLHDSPGSAAVLQGGDWKFTFSADARTRLWHAPGDPAAVGAADVALDIEPMDAAVAKVAAK